MSRRCMSPTHGPSACTNIILAAGCSAWPPHADRDPVHPLCTRTYAKPERVGPLIADRRISFAG
jgi:hypothetical protein